MTELGVGPGADLADLRNLADHIQMLRETDAATSGSNLALRDVEYYLRGRIGAELLTGGGSLDFSSPGALFNDLGNLGGPHAAAIYLALKHIKIGLGQSVAGDENLPNTPPGGFLSNHLGYNSGLLGLPLDQVDLETLTGAPTPPSYDPLSPLRPLSLDTSSSDIGIFHIAGQVPGSLVFFDPQVADYLAIAAPGSRISAFQLASPDIIGTLQLYVGDKVFTYTSGSVFDFVDVLGYSVDAFSLFGFPLTAHGSQLVYGLSFDSRDQVIVAALTGFDTRVAGPIPEPATWAMLIAGFALVGRAMRSGRRTLRPQTAGA